MIQGTSSHAGKSVLVAALLRILRRKGVRCAPFKPQNMALNSFVTAEGHEIGRAQAMQAEAALIHPTSDMNPVLLKPTTDSKAQVIVHGVPWRNMSAREYVAAKKELRPAVAESFQRLCTAFEAVVVEGAGSPAEINLRENDIANMGFARMFDIPVLVVGDIDRGGVYASFYGTYALLTAAERRLLRGFVINKFRGDQSLLAPANAYIKKRTGRPVAGVIPYFTDISVSDEDGVSLAEMHRKYAVPAGGDILKVAVLRLPRISNFTDFEPLFMEKNVAVTYASSPREAAGARLVIIPGSKNTVEDLLFLRAAGFESFLRSHVRRGGYLVGVCGGYQMLGRMIEDPHGVESSRRRTAGLGFLDAETVLERSKQLRQVVFRDAGGMCGPMTGYEIHMGVTTTGSGRIPFYIRDGRDERPDGLSARDGRVMGTYVHGLFDNDRFRREFLNKVRAAAGLKPAAGTFNYRRRRNDAYERLAALVERSVDMPFIERLLGL